MSESQDYDYTDEDKYANDSFETDVLESSVYASDGESSEVEKPKSASKELKAVNRNNDFWTCESSSDDDDVVLGHTIAEINTDLGDFDDERLSLTPAERIFQMASQRKSAGKTIITDDDDDEDDDDEEDDDEDDDYDLDDCEDNDHEIEEVDEIPDMSMPTKNYAKNYALRKFTKVEKQNKIVYDEEHVAFDTSGIDMTEVYTDVGDDGEVDAGEPSLYREIRDEENEESDDEMRTYVENEKNSHYEDSNWKEDGAEGSDNERANENYSENDCYSAVETSPSGTEDDLDDDEKTIGPASTVAISINEDKQSEPKSDPKSDPKSETKSLRIDDSMEDFKRKVLLSQRMRCMSDGGGDRALPKTRKSSIPVWIGNERLEKFQDSLKSSHSGLCLRSMIPVPDMRTHGSLPDFSDAETLRQQQHYYDEQEEAACGFDDELSGGDYNDCMSDDFKPEYDASEDGNSSAYSIQMQMFMDSKDIPKKPKKLKAGERRNKSFSNERLRDIERHNNILLHKILNQKPTYIIDERKKKKDKFAALPATTRVTSAEINRKKHQRQIDMDNQMLKRKLEAIAKRKPNT